MMDGIRIETERDGIRDFDFIAGSWRVLNRRLLKPLQGADEWRAFEAYQTGAPLMDGLVNYDELRSSQGELIGLSFRAYNRTTGRWHIHWVAERDGIVQPAVVGAFVGERGVFEGEDAFEGRPVRVRYVWSATNTDTPRWAQAFSGDGGRTWETNWIMDFSRIR